MVTTVARVFGVVFVLVGVLGFVPAAMTDGMLLGLFPVNTMHNVVHLLLGLWGLVAAGTVAGAIGYFKAIAAIYALLAVLGLIPATNDLFGLAPIHGNDVWLHAVLALAAAYFGFGPGARATTAAPA
ncbi:MAG: DUF4383 domain-containing protein [Gemmatimonadales bacterium]